MQSSRLFQKIIDKTNINDAIEAFAEEIKENGEFNAELEIPENEYALMLEKELVKDNESKSKFSIAIHDYLLKEMDTGNSIENIRVFKAYMQIFLDN
jgi:hypothetical protein